MTQRQATWLYLAAIALMAALLAALWWAPGPLAAWRHWQAPPPQAPKLDDVQAALLQANPAAAAAYPVVLARPLFDPTRRPPAPASATASAPARAPSPIEQVKLQGVIAGPTLNGVMLEEDGQSRFVRVGETVGDWTLQSVQGRQARFVRRGQQHVLDWAAAPSAEPAAPPARTAPRTAQRAPVPAATGAPSPRRANPPAAPAPQASPPPQASPAAPAAARGSFGGGARTPPSPRPATANR
ncbi:MAG: hypothetical protein R3E52_01005 [Burkholderiaceae bacterium]